MRYGGFTLTVTIWSYLLFSQYMPGPLWNILFPFYRWDKQRPRATLIFFFKHTSSVHLHTPIHVYTYTDIHLCMSVCMHIHAIVICELAGQIFCKELYYLSVHLTKETEGHFSPMYLNKESDKTKRTKNSEEKVKRSFYRLWYDLELWSLRCQDQPCWWASRAPGFPLCCCCRA